MTRPANLDRKVGAIVEHATEHGWLVNVEVGMAPSWRYVTHVNGIRTVGGHEFVFTTTLAVNPRTGRVATLQAVDRHDARLTMTTVAEPDRYWWSRRADAWQTALADPIIWCDLGAPAERRCPSCGGRAPWQDTAYVCDDCGDEWYEHQPDDEREGAG